MFQIQFRKASAHNDPICAFIQSKISQELITLHDLVLLMFSIISFISIGGLTYLIARIGNQQLILQKTLAENEIEIANSMSTLAKQVSHDIRSPLSALKMMMGQLNQVPEQQRVMIRGAIQRINDIANELLTKGKQIQQGQSSRSSLAVRKDGEKVQFTSQLLSPLIDTIVSEKRIQFREKQGVEIEADIQHSYGLFANINATELKRTVSNLLNNSIEAFPESKGRVIVAIRGYPDLVSIIIQDNGKGIPEHILAKLGEMVISQGKEDCQSGSGLGVYHAKRTVESFGGRFETVSREGVGTTISMNFPRAQAPKWFVEKLSLKPRQQVISLDDDLSIHGIWKGRFASQWLKELGIQHLTFTSGQEFKDWFGPLDDSTEQELSRLYLVDYELLNQNATGLDIIEELKIAKHAILVTSRYEEDKIRERCEGLGVRLTPKTMAGFVPIEAEGTKEFFNAILVDDDPLVHRVWQMVAQAKGKKFTGFFNFEDFLMQAQGFDFNSPLFVDSNLGNGIKGEAVSRHAHDLGFNIIYLCTGYDPDGFPPMPHLQGIIGKDPVF